ncbi:patatin-like phospholipase family protein [Ovoidimarina sediminis]|uniref:patatin-like phospholipase family protein n=1 Tax=Ovoidimarina sediminis TaxID=3079856 RepID=UPI00290661E7|nr:patatin-like phospholipase family protein [Rhodophyticola sp. MJ-SS7]MDU8946053.1 patatin-like phospholipase family protein [Rhodophyticola sp. MJ-SS7]
MDRPPEFSQIVFSGGGTRCFWQGGFLDVVRDPLALDPVRVSSVSGGVLSAVGFISHSGERIRDIMMRHFAEQDTNVTWHDAVTDDGVSPHQRVYRSVVDEALSAEVVAAVRDGPEFHALLAHPPRDSDHPLVASLMALAYEAELHLVNAPHFDWAEALGLGARLVDARGAARAGRLNELVCAAAVIPPVFEIAEWDGRPVIDGGMADQAPLPPGDEGPTLVVLTRDYERVPDHPDRLYVAPSRETPADKIDFTDPEKVAATWECGARDGRKFLERMNMN